MGTFWLRSVSPLRRQRTKRAICGSKPFPRSRRPAFSTRALMAHFRNPTKPCCGISKKTGMRSPERSGRAILSGSGIRMMKASGCQKYRFQSGERPNHLCSKKQGIVTRDLYLCGQKETIRRAIGPPDNGSILSAPAAPYIIRIDTPAGHPAERNVSHVLR